MQIMTTEIKEPCQKYITKRSYVEILFRLPYTK